MEKEWLDYRSSDGNMYFSFCFCNEGVFKGWKIQILDPIDYKGRNTGGHATHRLFHDNDDYDCICWEGKIRSLEEAKSVASLWGDITSLYIRGMGSFDTIAGKLVKGQKL